MSRQLLITCDVCRSEMSESSYRGQFSLSVRGEVERVDVCSPACMLEVLAAVIADVKEKAVAGALAPAAAAASPEEAPPVGPPVTAGPAPAPSVTAGPAPAPPVTAGPAAFASGPAMVGCSACNAGMAFTEETAFKHTGHGTRCASPEASAAAPPAAGPEAPRRRGRPPGSKNKSKAGEVPAQVLPGQMTLAQDVVEDLITFARLYPGVASGSITPEQVALVNAGQYVAELAARAVKPPPSPGYAMTASGRTSSAAPNAANGPRSNGPLANGSPNGRDSFGEPLPQVNLSQIATDAAAKGIQLSLADLATLTRFQIDVLASYLTNGGDLPDFLSVQ